MTNINIKEKDPLLELKEGTDIIENSNLGDGAKTKLTNYLSNKILFGLEYSEELTDLNKKYEILGFKPGEYIVSNSDWDSEVGIITSHRNNLGGIYSSVRYPINIKYLRGTFEYGIFTSNYEEFNKLENSEASVIDFLNNNDVAYKILEKEIGEQVYNLQKYLLDLLILDEQIFQNYIESEEFKSINLPYIHKFAEKLEDGITSSDSIHLKAAIKNRLNETK